MAGTRTGGPWVALGTTLSSPPTNVLGARDGTYAGPDIAYQGQAIIDPRYSPANKDSQNLAIFPSFLMNPFFCVVDNIPTAAATATVAPGAHTVSGTAFTLVTAAAGSSTAGAPSLAPKTPLIPFQGTTAQKVSVLAIDMGFTSGDTTAGNATILTIPDSTIFYVGQWLCVGGAGSATHLSSLICQVTAVPTTTTVVVSPAPLGTLVGSPIASANSYGPFPAGATAVGVQPYWWGGEGLIFNPQEGIARGLSVTGVASGIGGTIVVAGYDVYGVKMTENIVATTGATTAYGNKAFKYIASVTPLFTDAHNYYIGLSDVFGFNLRSDEWEFTQTLWNGGLLTANTGWTAALGNTAVTATAATADVRGTFQISASGPGTFASATASSGAIRLTMMTAVKMPNAVNASAMNPAPLLGLTQA